MSHVQQVQKTPTYRRHRASGQAIVTLGGKMFYLGSYGSKASHVEYDRLIAEWLTAGRTLPANPKDLTVSELAARYWKHAKTHCRSATGHRGEIASIKLLLAHLRTLHGPKPVTEFGPLAMKGVREAMVNAGWSRIYCNAQTNRLRRVWKWGVQNEMVAAEAWHALQAVEGLRHGKTQAPECEPIKPVDAEHVDATLPFVSRPVKAMIELQSLTGMRPGEIVIMRGCDLQTAGHVWVYTPSYFKTQHRGHTRSIPLGPKAQAVIGPMLKANPQAYLFCPAQAEADRREGLHAIRKTPSSCGNTPGSNRTRKPMRKPGDRYDVDSYRRAIARACDQAIPPATHLKRQKVEDGARWETAGEWRTRLGEKGWAELQAWRAANRWHPNQLRHTAATRLRKEFGLEAAQVILGHRSLTVTQIYAEKNVQAAQEIMAQVG